MKAKGERGGPTEQQINDNSTDSAQYKNVDKEYGIDRDFWRNVIGLVGLLAGVPGGNVTGTVRLLERPVGLSQRQILNANSCFY